MTNGSSQILVDMPPLGSGLDAALGLSSLAALLVDGRGVQDATAGTLTISLCRLIEHACSEYSRARALLRVGDMHDYIRNLLPAVSSLETGLVSTHRSIEALWRIRRAGLRFRSGRPLVNRPAELPILSDAVRNRYRALRDAIQHLEERTASRNLHSVGIHIIRPAPHHLALENHRLKYSAWAEDLAVLHGQASLLLEVWREDDSSYRTWPVLDDEV